ncbi:MAG: response regulator [Polyangiaceae bacterium]
MQHGSHTILVVEDDVDVRESLRDALEDDGYKVAVAADGLEALEYLASHLSRRSSCSTG